MLPFCSLTHKWYLVYLFPFQSRGRLRARALSDETGVRAGQLLVGLEPAEARGCLLHGNRDRKLAESLCLSEEIRKVCIRC